MTKQIPLTKGQVAIVDDSDYEYLMQWSWHINSKGYAMRSTRVPFRKSILMHRVIINPPNGYQIDHINGNTLDNRRENLRICTPKQNSRNRKVSSNNTTGYNGVSYNQRDKKYLAYIDVSGNKIFLGNFSNIEDAAKARKKAEKKYYGEFARNG